MPDRGLEGLAAADRETVENHEPGYDWVPDRFGPPPGIPRNRKLRLDRMTDRDYIAAVLRMGQEEKECLMISEAERLRTYRSLWPNPQFVDYRDLARQGFYYTGVSDRVQCAFCAGFLGNWERGDVPQQLHREFFSHCKMAQRMPCANIPLSREEQPTYTAMPLVTIRRGAEGSSNASPSLSELGISQDNPRHPEYRVHARRLGTYRPNYSTANPMSPEELGDAGFFFQGPGDNVRCFWCDGALEAWAEGDDAWAEHAKWYPGCGYVQLVKGKEYIRQRRAEMSEEDRTVADALQYNNADISFLTENPESESSASDSRILSYDTYQVCKGEGFTDDELKEAFRRNQDHDFSDVQVLIDVLLALRENKLSDIDNIVKQEAERRAGAAANEVERELASLNISSATRFLDVERICKTQPEDLTEDDNRDLVGAMTCSQCAIGEVGAAVLPCGHLILCHDCCINRLPEKCCVCGNVVRGGCRAFLG